MGRLRERLPTTILEAVSVVFAVLVALAVDEWREDRQHRELADRAIDAIVSEIESNQKELDGGLERNERFLAHLDSVIAVGSGGLTADFEYALLSAAAWQTTQITRATTYLDYGLVQRVARTYELQELFVENQRVMVDLIAGGGVGMNDEERTPVALAGRLRVLLQLQEGLEGGYGVALAALRGNDPGG